MAGYTIYHVWSGRIKSGKTNLFAQWYAHCGQEMMAGIPGVRSVRAFARQFGLGPGEQDAEIWMEIEDYGMYDRFDRDILDNPDKYQAWSEIDEFLDQRTSRIMGDFPASAILPDTQPEAEGSTS